MKGKVLKNCIAIVLCSGIVFSSSSVRAMNLESCKINVLSAGVLVAKNNCLENGKYNVSMETLKEKSDDISMAGQYINKKTLLEANNGETYLTLTITRIDWMKNIKVFIDNSEVQYDVINKGKDGQVADIRFKVPNTKPNIKFNMNVVPMGNANVNFRIDLQNDITKINGEEKKENKVSKNVKEEKGLKESSSTPNNSEKELPQTGGLVSQKGLLTIGSLAAVVGIILRKRK